MPELTKTYNVASGELKFKFYYFWADLHEFEILNIGELSKGFDNENNLDIASYPDNIELTIDGFTGDNYNNFRTLYEAYSGNYPNDPHFDFSLTVYLNGIEKFKGFICEVESDKNNYEIKAKFIDGINYLKDYSIANPDILHRLWLYGILPRVELILFPPTVLAYSYGFSGISYSSSLRGYYVSQIQTGDMDVKLQQTIEQLFKLLNNNISIDFQNEFTFSDLNTAEVLISEVFIRRILSNLFGRYIVINKVGNFGTDIVQGSSLEYAKPQYFERIYETDTQIVYYHNWNGTLSDGTKWERGVGERTIAGILKILAKNLFSYFGFQSSEKVFFRHRRFNNEIEAVWTGEEIISMNKILTVDRVQGVRIEDYYTANYATDGKDYDTDNIPQITYKIPLNAFQTDNGYEYRLNYFIGGAEKRVLYFNDLQNNYKDIPQEVISRAEWNAYRVYRDKYDIVLNGVNYKFDKTYEVDYENYQGRFRLITMSENFLTDETRVTAMEVFP